jgi:hypothetical protein
VLKNKNDTFPGLASKTYNRCEGVRCIFHEECETNYCFKADYVSRADVVGVCSRPIQKIHDNEEEPCSLTVSDVTRPGKLFEKYLTMNRCENIKCLYDSECADGLFCHQNRYCVSKSLRMTLGAICNTTEKY